MSDGVRRGYIRQVAKQLRRAGHIKEPPVDLPVIVAACGLKYREVDYFPEEVDALIVCSDAGNVAVVNSRQSEARRRFSLAHEIGHYMLHRNGSEIGDTPTIDSPPADDDESFSSSAAEREANLFARELLVPIEFLKAFFCPGMEAGDIASRFSRQRECGGYCGFRTHARAVRTEAAPLSVDSGWPSKLSPPRSQNSGGIRRIAVDSRELADRGKAL
jgi:hypothetical protein